MLWVSANPGCGKSVLAKYLADRELRSEGDRTTCYFFFKDVSSDQRSANGAVSCILHQLFMQKRYLFSDRILKRFEVNSKEHLLTSFEELWDALIISSQDKHVGEVVCILDAFDECDNHERKQLAAALCKLYGEENDFNLKFLITSRPEERISLEFNSLKMKGFNFFHLEGEDTNELNGIAKEIDCYMEDKVATICKTRSLGLGDQRLLLDSLRRNQNRTYLWVYLILEWIEGDISTTSSKTNIQEIASSIPQTADEAYEKILAKVGSTEKAHSETKKQRQLKKLLNVIVAATEPLTCQEMNVALSLTASHESYKDLDEIWKYSSRCHQYIKELGGQFISIIAPDSRVYLLHQTAKDFLLGSAKLDRKASVSDANPPKWKASIHPEEAHRALFEICMWHLRFTEFKTDTLIRNSKDISQYLKDHPFISYSAMNWAFHFRAAGLQEDEFQDYLLQICRADSTHCPAWFKLYWAKVNGDFPQGFTTLMIASHFGIKSIVKHLLQEGNPDIDSVDGVYQRSALSWASQNGFDGIVKLLIEGPKFRLIHIARLSFSKGAKVDAIDKVGRTPLAYAALNGHKTTIEILLAKGASPHSKDKTGGTPVFYYLSSGDGNLPSPLLNETDEIQVNSIRAKLILSAAKKGDRTVVERLLHNNVSDSNIMDYFGRTPLSHAAQKGHEAVTEILLQNGANPNPNIISVNNHEPLSYAAAGGHVAVAQLLLVNGANPNGYSDQRRYGWTPLYAAMKASNLEMVKLLLNNGANMELLGETGRAPLHIASRDGQIGIVRLLLEHGANVYARDQDGETPLMYASRNNHFQICKILLENEAINQGDSGTHGHQHVNCFGQTPLHHAALHNHSMIYELLGSKFEAWLSWRDNRGRTPRAIYLTTSYEPKVRQVQGYTSDRSRPSSNLEPKGIIQHGPSNLYN
ncbi:ankyrin repeat-containing protein [Penicillium herquei]|nr:ankyrin repeat-containing protein [Penicillium herquei]